MRFSAMNLKHLLSATLCGVVLLGGTTAYAQRRAEHRALKQHQKFEKRAYKERWSSDERRLYGNSRDWRERRRAERIALRRHQQAERRTFRQSYNPGRRLARGRYIAPGQRLRYTRRTNLWRTRFYR